MRGPPVLPTNYPGCSGRKLAGIPRDRFSQRYSPFGLDDSRDTVAMVPQLASAWVIRLIMFAAVSLWTSAVVDYLRRRADKLYHETVGLTRSSMAVGALVDLAEMRDQQFTGYHSRRLGAYADVLCTYLQMDPALHRNIVDTIGLHDIGKVAIPDAVLMKPDKLEPHEWEAIKRHPVYGEQILDSICRHAQTTSEAVLSFLRTAREIVAAHHEKFDGSGYPKRLKGEEIPLSARIAAVCDVYDSLRSQRPYKKRYCHETAVQIICKGSGTHFDPEIVDAFLAVQDKFARIWDELEEKALLWRLLKPPGGTTQPADFMILRLAQLPAQSTGIDYAVMTHQSQG